MDTHVPGSREHHDDADRDAGGGKAEAIGYMRRARALLVALVAFTMAASMVGTLPSQPGGSESTFGLTSLGDVGNVVRGLVGGGDNGPPPAEPIAELALPRDERAPTGKRKKTSKRVRELTGRRTGNTRFFQLSDGRVQAEVSSAPHHYRDAKGRYRPIDTTVSGTDRDGYRYGNTTNTHQTWFADDRATVVSDGATVSLGARTSTQTAVDGRCWP